jgi:hypothetical protein
MGKKSTASLSQDFALSFEGRLVNCGQSGAAAQSAQSTGLIVLESSGHIAPEAVHSEESEKSAIRVDSFIHSIRFTDMRK